MIDYQFSILNTATNELRVSTGTSLNVAARAVGITVPFRGSLPAPWQAWECRDTYADKVLWHVTADGSCVQGDRP